MGEELQEQLQTRILWESPFDVPLVGPIHISESVVMTWFLMAIIMVLVLILTRNLKIVPGKRQAFLEMAVTWLTNFFEGNMGKAGRRYVPYLSTVLIYLGIANMIGMFGFGMKPPTKDINVTVALALMSIILIEASTFRAQGGIKGFLKSFTKPMALLTPLNVMEIAIRPLSLCMRLFGNVLGAFVVMKLIEHVCGLIIPMVFSMYFDVFDGHCRPCDFCYQSKHGSRGGECAEVTAGIACCNPTRQLQKGAFPMVGAGIAVLTGIGAGLGIGIATSKATEAIARQPEAAGAINKALLLGCALAEATAIYGFVVALLMVIMK